VITKASVDLSGAAQTMLTTLYLKALDADFRQPVLGDKYAKDAIDHLDYDWTQIGITHRWAPLITVRTAQYDIWASQFLAMHPQSTVIHLGCGLDSRVFRLNPGPDVQWYDVDYPSVIALREQIYPPRSHYQLVPTSATDPAWLDQIPSDRPALLLAEGISMYLTQQDGVTLLQRFVDHFPSGELQIDFYNWFGIRSQKMQTLIRRSGSTLHWAVNSPDDIRHQVDGIRLLAATSIFDAGTFSRASRTFQVAKRVLRVAPAVRNTLQYHRYAFGPAAL
jgi:O-methyltransferase involved in polyketide biosynthesis